MTDINLIVFFAVTGGLFLLYLALGELVVDRLFFASDAPERPKRHIGNITRIKRAQKRFEAKKRGV